MQALSFYTSRLKIIDAIDISSRINTDAKAIAKCLVVHILIAYLFSFFIVDFFMCFADKIDCLFLLFSAPNAVLFIVNLLVIKKLIVCSCGH